MNWQQHFLTLLSLAGMAQVGAFTISTAAPIRQRTSLHSSQYDDEYLQALREAAKDPKSFELFVAQHNKKTCKNNAEYCGLSDVPGLPNDGVEGERPGSKPYLSYGSKDSAPTAKKNGGYKPVEEWDKERKEKGILTWEEKVQFEGQRMGNRVKQNDILRHHLNSF